jgi:type III secretion protein J
MGMPGRQPCGGNGVRGRRARLLAVVGALGLGAVGCSVPIEVGLDDPEANRVFLALDRAGVDAVKEPDPTAEGCWRITVAREDAARALAAMRDDGLPHAKPSRAEGSTGALLQSEASEQAQSLATIAQSLRASIESVAGVLGARVHIAPPPIAGLLHEGASPFARASASVLFEYRGAVPPLGADSVQRLVAGAVTGLAASDVSVVMVPVPAPEAPASGGLAHVGPIVVARSSMGRLEAALAVLLSVVAILAGAVLALSSRLGRLRARLAAAEERAAADAAPHDSGPRAQLGALRRGIP